MQCLVWIEPPVTLVTVKCGEKKATGPKATARGGLLCNNSPSSTSPYVAITSFQSSGEKCKWLAVLSIQCAGIWRCRAVQRLQTPLFSVPPLILERVSPLLSLNATTVGLHGQAGTRRSRRRRRSGDGAPVYQCGDSALSQTVLITRG